MKLATFGLTFKEENLGDKFGLLRGLLNKELANDPYWFYALHPEGMTLRCSPQYVERVIKTLKKQNINFRKDKHYYEPFKHEYYIVHVLGNDIVPLLHSISVLIVKYSPNIAAYPTLERLCHMTVNMTGTHDFYKEALLYLDLAEKRAKLDKLSLPLPTKIYKIAFWIRRKLWALKKTK